MARTALRARAARAARSPPRRPPRPSASRRGVADRGASARTGAAMWLDREGPRGCLHEPATAHPAQLGGEGAAALSRYVLDDARAVHEVELPVRERQAGGRVGAHERPWVGGLVGEIYAGDVQLWLERPQPQAPATHVEHARPWLQPGEREEALMAAPARPRRERRGDAGEGVGGGGVDVAVGGSRSGHASRSLRGATRAGVEFRRGVALGAGVSGCLAIQCGDGL